MKVEKSEKRRLVANAPTLISNGPFLTGESHYKVSLNPVVELVDDRDYESSINSLGDVSIDEDAEVSDTFSSDDDSDSINLNHLQRRTDEEVFNDNNNKRRRGLSMIKEVTVSNDSEEIGKEILEEDSLSSYDISADYDEETFTSV